MIPFYYVYMYKQCRVFVLLRHTHIQIINHTFRSLVKTLFYLRIECYFYIIWGVKALIEPHLFVGLSVCLSVCLWRK